MRWPWNVIAWWEMRRIPFNLLVGGVGVLSLLIIDWVGSRFVPLGEDIEEPMGIILGVIGYGIMANLYYTLGWITELRQSPGSSAEIMRAKWFRSGLIFSILLTLLPAALVSVVWIVRGS